MANHTYCIELMEGDHDYLLSLSKNRTIQAQIVERAKILLQKEAGKTDKSVAGSLCIDVNTVHLCVQKYLEGGTELALYDRQRKGRPPEISADAVAWIINTACQRPADLGYPQELWTIAGLHKHIQGHAAEAGFPCLASVSKARIQQILKGQEIKPFKIKYYCEKRDPDFETKMHNVLTVYKQVEMQFDGNGDIIVPDDYRITITVPYDEKPESRPLQTRRMACVQQWKTGRFSVIMNIRGLGQFPCWPASACLQAKPSRWWATAIKVRILCVS